MAEALRQSHVDPLRSISRRSEALRKRPCGGSVPAALGRRRAHIAAAERSLRGHQPLLDNGLEVRLPAPFLPQQKLAKEPHKSLGSSLAELADLLAQPSTRCSIIKDRSPHALQNRQPVRLPDFSLDNSSVSRSPHSVNSGLAELVDSLANSMRTPTNDQQKGCMSCLESLAQPGVHAASLAIVGTSPPARGYHSGFAPPLARCESDPSPGKRFSNKLAANPFGLEDASPPPVKRSVGPRPRPSSTPCEIQRTSERKYSSLQDSIVLRKNSKSASTNQARERPEELDLSEIVPRSCLRRNRSPPRSAPELRRVSWNSPVAEMVVAITPCASKSSRGSPLTFDRNDEVFKDLHTETAEVDVLQAALFLSSPRKGDEDDSDADSEATLDFGEDSNDQSTSFEGDLGWSPTKSFADSGSLSDFGSTWRRPRSQPRLPVAVDPPEDITPPPRKDSPLFFGLRTEELDDQSTTAELDMLQYAMTSSSPMSTSRAKAHDGWLS